MSVTHGPAGSRQHIWTFTAYLFEDNPGYAKDYIQYNCACTNTQYNWTYQLPSFIQNNYFCDTGNPEPGWNEEYLVTDPLWDGAGCRPNNTCCQFNNPPWFKFTLPQGTSDDIELQLCYHAHTDEDILVYLIELYVQ